MTVVETLWLLLQLCRQGNLSNYPLLETLTPPFVRRSTNASLRKLSRAIESIGARRHRQAFENVSRVVIFVGHGRSGHSLIGSLLDAHEHAIVAHELDALGAVEEGVSEKQLFFQLLARSRWFQRRGAKWSGYRYAVPSQYKGEFTSLKVIGDKKGGESTKHLRRNPDLLRRLWQVVGRPIHVLHVKRHPLDNISTLARKDYDGDLDAAIDHYFRDCTTVRAVKEQRAVQDWMNWHDLIQEEFIEDTQSCLAQICDVLQLPITDDYLDDCAEVVFDRPSRSRKKVSYSEAQLDQIRTRMASFPSLEPYSVP
jgi:hypothetical protein